MEFVISIMVVMILMVVLPKDPQVVTTSHMITNLTNPVPSKTINRFPSSDTVIGVWLYNSHVKIAEFLDTEILDKEKIEPQISYTGGEPDRYEIYKEWVDNCKQVNTMYDKKTEVKLSRSSNNKSNKVVKLSVAN